MIHLHGALLAQRRLHLRILPFTARRHSFNIGYEMDRMLFASRKCMEAGGKRGGKEGGKEGGRVGGR